MKDINITGIELENILKILGEIPSKYSFNLLVFFNQKIKDNERD
jgi:hypothetical protein